MTRLLAALVVCAVVQQAATDEDVLRGLVQQYYDAQTTKNVDRAAGFWSASANPRLGRDAFAAVFGAGDAEYVADVQLLSIKGEEARLRVSIEIARTVFRNDVPTILRQTQLNAQLWRREGATWKLLRDGPVAEDVADELIASAPGDREKLLARYTAEVSSSLRAVLSQRGSSLATQAQYARARGLFELALLVARSSRDRRSESETLQSLANACYFLGDYDSANRHYGARLDLSRQLNDTDGHAASLLGLATVAYSRGEYTPALVAYREALGIYEQRADAGATGRTLVSVGNVQYLQAEYGEAAACYRRALDLLVTAGDTQGAAFARSGLARVFAAEGDLAAALDSYVQVLAEARSRAPASRAETAAALESIGDLHFRLANTDQARASFDEARRLQDAVPAEAGRLFGSLALTELVAGRFDAALANYLESRARFESARSPDGVAHAWVGIGYSQAAREQYGDAIAAYKTAVQLFEAQAANESAARAWLGLSSAQTGAADHSAALESARKVQALAGVVKSVDLRWRGDVRAGEVLRKLGRHLDALQAFRSAITAIEQLAAEAPTNLEARGQLEGSASAWSGLAFVVAAQGDASGALAAIEARRAHIRRVQLAGFQRDITRGTTVEERAEEQAIVRELISTRAQLRAERTARTPDAPRLEKLQQQLAAVIARRADQQSRLYARLPQLERWRGLSSPTAGDTNALVQDSRALLLEYLVGDDEVLAVSVAHGAAPDLAAAVLPVNRRTLATQIDQLMQPRVLQDQVEWRTRAMPIAAALLEPLAGRLRQRDRLVIVPDDLLWRVPFEALPAGESDVAAEVAVTYATSLATLGAQRAITPQPRGDRVAAAVIGAPAIPTTVKAQMTLTSPSWTEPDALTSTRAVTDFAKFYGDAASLKVGADASEAAVQASLASFDVVHVVAPLRMSGATPLFSSLLLAGSGDRADNDGRWEAREWFDLEGAARVLIIPDASTLGSAGIGEAMDTLMWAAAAANLPNMVLGRWPADGFSADAFLSAFHAELAKGVAVDAAWRAATISGRGKVGGSPAGWAGLRLIGAGRQ
ncbi:MAG: tetratricopeptide repeat protein [Vicinamibacterales bacterium]